MPRRGAALLRLIAPPAAPLRRGAPQSASSKRRRDLGAVLLAVVVGSRARYRARKLLILIFKALGMHRSEVCSYCATVDITDEALVDFCLTQPFEHVVVSALTVMVDS